MKNIMILLFIICILIINCTSVKSAEWVHYATAKGLEDQYFYDKTSIFTDSDGALRVWIKQVFSSRGKPHFIESMKEKGFSDKKKLEKIDYVLDYFAIKCNSKEYNLISYYVRDKQGNNIDSDKPEQAWVAIKAGSIMEILYKAVCK